MTDVLRRGTVYEIVQKLGADRAMEQIEASLRVLERHRAAFESAHQQLVTKLDGIRELVKPFESVAEIEV